MSFPKRSDIFNSPVWTVKDIVARPSIDTFYQVNFAFSGNARKWIEYGGGLSNINPNSSPEGLRAAQNSGLASGSRRVSGYDVQRKFTLLCTDAEIPGTSYLTTEARSHYQGINQSFPTFREFPPLNLTFYLDADHVILNVLENWMKFINPISDMSLEKKKNAYSRFNYPDDYKERLHLTKYERDIRDGSRMSQYEFINLWPQNLTSMRINYGNSAVVRVSAQFAYDRFFTQFNVMDSTPHVEALPPNIRDTDAIVNRNNNRWWTQNLPLGMNDQIRSLQAGFA